MSIMTNKQIIVLALVFSISNYIMAGLAGLWWLDGSGEYEYIVFLAGLYVILYEFGFKICFQRFSKLWFYLGFMLPAVLGTIGYSIGLIKLLIQ